MSYSTAKSVIVNSSSTGGFGVNVKSFGAKGDVQTVFDAAASSTVNPTIVTSASGLFTPGDIGKAATLRGAGAGPAPHYTTIVGYNSPTSLTMANGVPVTVSGQRFDWGTSDIAAFNTAASNVPAAGGTLYIPAGRYFLRMPPVYHLNNLALDRGNITIAGDGMGQTELLYSSAASDGTVGPGDAIIVGLGNTVFSNFTIRDLSIRDLETRSIFPGGHNPAALESGLMNNLRIERCGFYNAKGNSAIAIQGTFSGSPPLPTISDCCVIDCLFLGDAASGYIQGDGINIGNYNNVHFQRNRISGVGRHGYEGGGACYSQYFEDNDINMLQAGMAGFSATGGSRTSFVNNKIYNMSLGFAAIDCTVDVGGTFSAADIQVRGNYISGPTFGVKFQNTSGVDGGVSILDRYMVNDNWIEAQSCVDIPGDVGYRPTIMIHNNVFKLLTNGVVLNSNSGAKDTAITQHIDVRGNIVLGDVTGGHGIYDAFAWAQSYQFHIEDNVVGDNLSDASGGNSNGQYGKVGFCTGTGGGTLAANTSITFYSARDCKGGLPGDNVTIILPASWPDGILVYGRITPADKIDIMGYNTTAGGLAYPAADFYYYLKRG